MKLIPEVGSISASYEGMALCSTEWQAECKLRFPEMLGYSTSDKGTVWVVLARTEFMLNRPDRFR